MTEPRVAVPFTVASTKPVRIPARACTVKVCVPGGTAPRPNVSVAPATVDSGKREGDRRRSSRSVGVEVCAAGDGREAGGKGQRDRDVRRRVGHRDRRREGRGRNQRRTEVLQRCRLEIDVLPRQVRVSEQRREQIGERETSERRTGQQAQQVAKFDAVGGHRLIRCREQVTDQSARGRALQGEDQRRDRRGRQNGARGRRLTERSGRTVDLGAVNERSEAGRREPSE